VTRSFDGGRVAWDRPAWNVTAFGFVPTRGGFEVSANRELDAIWLTGISLTAKRIPAAPLVARLFYLYYRDARQDALKVDNRPKQARRGQGADHHQYHRWERHDGGRFRSRHRGRPALGRRADGDMGRAE
jgi:hypothetical protein